SSQVPSRTSRRAMSFDLASHYSRRAFAGQAGAGLEGPGSRPAPLLLPRLVQTVDPRRRVMDDLLALLLGQLPEALRYDLLRAREGRRRMGIVGRPHDVVRAIAMQ